MEFDEFLNWFRHRTEAAWQNHEPRHFYVYLQSGVGGTDWRPNTLWIGGFSESEIKDFERRWNIKFPPDYRQFLSVLGAPNKDMVGLAWSQEREREGMAQISKPSFYNWKSDEVALKNAFEWPLDGLLFDIEHDLWLSEWGPRPNAMKDRKKLISNLVAEAPPLIPIIGHRYLVGYPIEAGNMVLSVYQSDIIVYGTDFRRFLIAEVRSLLGIDEIQATHYSNKNYDKEKISSIPFWGNIMIANS